jgi:hypothetical protein
MCYKRRAEKPERNKLEKVNGLSESAAGLPAELNQAAPRSRREPELAMSYCPRCSDFY